LHQGPWEVSDSHKYAPGLRKSPWKEWGARNWVPRHGRWRLWPKSGEVAAGVGGERWGKCLGTHQRPICGLVGGERVASGADCGTARRRCGLCSPRRFPTAPAESRVGAARRARLWAAAPFIGEARHVRDRTARGWARTASVRRRRWSTPRHSVPGDSGRATSCRVIATGRCVAPGNAASGSALALGAQAGAQTQR
jgi:hypothetical protein